ncbi:MAG: PLP-dependent aminotransferase family protein [Blastocatellia bacterium]|nr:PLP-dependent aminotransferase family protein [Blastocatellia bacterium]
MSKIGTSAVREILGVTEQPDIISFAGGMPAPELFPVEEFARAHAQVFAEEGAAAMQYNTTEGWLPLRKWIAGRLAQRGIAAETDRVLITTGSQQAINLAATIFIDAGDEIIVEDPSYLAALQTFNGFEASFVPVEGDDYGMRPDLLERALKDTHPKFIYVVPNFHNPKGTTMTLERRKQLIALSNRYSVPIIEDDPYGELRYEGERVAPIASLDENGMVIYISTFSKTISPGMRIGWVHASREIIRNLISAKQADDLHTCTIEQRAVARMLSSFDYDGHLVNLRRAYGERRNAMLSALEEHFPEGVQWTKPNGGLFIWVELPEYIRGEELLEDALLDHVAFVPGATFFSNVQRHNFIRLNFSNRPPDVIEEGIRRIARVLKRRMR